MCCRRCRSTGSIQIRAFIKTLGQKQVGHLNVLQQVKKMRLPPQYDADRCGRTELGGFIEFMRLSGGENIRSVHPFYSLLYWAHPEKCPI